MSDDIATRASESDIADAIMNSPALYHRMTIRRLAFERDQLRNEVEKLRSLQRAMCREFERWQSEQKART